MNKRDFSFQTQKQPSVNVPKPDSPQRKNLYILNQTIQAVFEDYAELVITNLKKILDKVQNQAGSKDIYNFSGNIPKDINIYIQCIQAVINLKPDEYELSQEFKFIQEIQSKEFYQYFQTIRKDVQTFPQNDFPYTVLEDGKLISKSENFVQKLIRLRMARQYLRQQVNKKFTQVKRLYNHKYPLKSNLASQSVTTLRTCKSLIRKQSI